MTPTAVQLPFELVETIVEHLSDDAPSLKACASVSSIFLETSQRRLFDTVVISPPPCNQTTKASHTSPTTKLHDLLVRSPHISKYIHHLQLENVGVVTTNAQGVNTHWLAQDVSFALILPLLPSVKSLVWHSGMCGLNWYALPPTTRRTLQEAFSQWPLERFEVTAMVNLPLPVIKTMKNLRHLSLSVTHFVERELPTNAVSCDLLDEETEDRPLPLRSLSIVDPSRHLMSTLTRWVVDNADLSILEALTWNTYGSYLPKGDDMVEMLKILEPAAGSIRTLEVVPSLDGTSTAAIPALSIPSLGYPNLESLTLGFELSPHSPSSSLWFKTSFSNVASSRSIANLERVRVRCHVAQESPSTNFDPELWGLQDALIHPVTEEMKAKRLKEVDVQLHSVYSVTRDEMGKMRKRIVDGLESLPKRVKVSVTEPLGQA